MALQSWDSWASSIKKCHKVKHLSKPKPALLNLINQFNNYSNEQNNENN